MERLDKWEKCQGHRWTGERVERKEQKGITEPEGFVFKKCKKVSKSKGGRRQICGERASSKDKKRCACGKEYSKSYSMINLICNITNLYHSAR